MQAFAVVRETALRLIGLRHYDSQLIGGAVLFEVRQHWRVESLSAYAHGQRTA